MGGGRGGPGSHELLVLRHGPGWSVGAAVPVPPVADLSAAVGLGALQDLDPSAGPRRCQPGQGPAPALDPAGLLARGQEHVGRVGDAGDGGQGLLVRVMDHHRTGCGVGQPAQRRGVSGQRQGPGWAGLARADREGRLSLGAAQHEVRSGGRGLDDGPPTPGDERCAQQGEPDAGGRGHPGDARDHQGGDEHRGAGADARDPRGGEAQQEAAR